MSKQSEAKEKQGYTPKATPRTCATCGHFQMDTVERESFGQKWTEDKNLRCGIGGFAVKKMATCNMWSDTEVEIANPMLCASRRA